MKTFKEHILTERFINLFDTSTKHRYADEVWDILQNSYKEIGGIKGSGFRSKEDMIENIPFWKLAKKGNKVVAVSLYKDKQGRKKVAGGTDGSEEGKKEFAKMTVDELLHGRSWGEISDKMYWFTRKHVGAENLDKYLIPAKKVQELMPEDEIVPVDEYWYKRQLGSGDWKQKIAIGNPKQNIY